MEEKREEMERAMEREERAIKEGWKRWMGMSDEELEELKRMSECQDESE